MGEIKPTKAASYQARGAWEGGISCGLAVRALEVVYLFALFEDLDFLGSDLDMNMATGVDYRALLGNRRRYVLLPWQNSFSKLLSSPFHDVRSEGWC